MFLLLASCAGSTGLVATEHSRTIVEDFEPAQRRTFAETLEALGALAPGDLAIDAETYEQSRFSKVFGFALDGPKLLGWWSRRIQRVRRGDAWTVAVYDGEGAMTVTDEFFERSLLERLFVLIHEARHADGDGYDHVECPYSGSLACDARPDGAYAYQAAFLFELYAYGLVDPKAAFDEWRTTMRRILSVSRTAPRR